MGSLRLFVSLHSAVFRHDAPRCTGANADANEGNLDLPDITGIGMWQISDMLDGGALSLTIIAVPEPTRGLLVLCGCVMLAMRRRRK